MPNATSPAHGNTCPEPRRGIPDAVIASVKNNTSFPALLRQYGIQTTKKGKSLFATCPFHEIDGHPENTASLSIDPTLNLYHCFSCNARGNVIQFVMEIEKVTFPEAVEKLLAVKGARVERAAKEKSDAAPAPVAVELTEEERQTILREVLSTTTEALRNSKPGREYLEGRGLDPLKLLDAYTFGFWNGTTYGKLESGEKKKLAGLGLYNGGSRALFENCIVFPLEKDGRITTIYGRKTSTNGATADGRHYLLPCKREGLFLPRSGLNPQRPVIITESIIDGLSLFAAGVTNVLPLLGVNGFLADHLEYLKAQRFPMIYIALNGDEAGNKAAAQLKQNLAVQQLPAEIIQLPDSKDLNDMLREIGPGKLREWFEERTASKQKTGDKPTVWEDDNGETVILVGDTEYRVYGLSPHGMDRLQAKIRVNAVSDVTAGDR